MSALRAGGLRGLAHQAGDAALPSHRRTAGAAPGRALPLRPLPDTRDIAHRSFGVMLSGKGHLLYPSVQCFNIFKIPTTVREYRKNSDPSNVRTASSNAALSLVLRFEPLNGLQQLDDERK